MRQKNEMTSQNALYQKAKIMTIKMAKVRGFDLDSIDNSLLSADSSGFKVWLEDRNSKDTVENRLSKIYFKTKEKDIIVAVQIFFFASSSKYSNQGVVDEFQNMIKKYMHPDIKVIGTIISDWKLSKNAMDRLGKEYPFLVQTFELADFGYDFSTHAFGADYYRVTDIKELYNMKPGQLPSVNMEDKIAKFYGWEEGTIVAMQFCNITIESVGNTCIEYFRVIK